MASLRHTLQASGTSTAETIVERRDVSTHKDQTLPPVIPSAHQTRTLVLCFDGTGDQFDADNSNVVQFVSLLKKDDRNKQLVYYQTGIGTYTGATRTVSPFMSQIRKVVDTMFAQSIDAHIMGGYKFLMQNYSAGDKICIFGFSRGAYTARCLAGMLHKVGLLPPSNAEQIPFAYTMYMNTDGTGWEQSNEFKRAFSINVDIEFLGVWDTVGSIGFKPEGLPFATSNTFIRTYRHAVSLDERRAKFQPNLWNKPTPEEAKLGLPDPNVRPGPKALNQDGSEKPETDIEEVWFAGCHCDVGGGSVSNRTRHSLARIPLRWMVREIFKANPGILFLTDRIYEIGLDPSTIYPAVLDRPDSDLVGENKIREPPVEAKPIRPSMYRPWKKVSISEVSEPRETGPAAMLASEEREELMDALSPIYDQMSIKKGWWFLEMIPLPLRRQWDGLTWSTRLWFNFGRSRAVKWSPGEMLKVHRSVKMRMEAEYEDEYKRKSGKYQPRVTFQAEPLWIE